MRAIVFFLRGCPAAWLGAYGNEWVGTPNLDRLAAQAVVFERHISDCPDPNAACRSWIGEGLPTARSALVRANHPDTDSPASFYASWGEVFDARPQQADASPLDNLIRSLPSILDRLQTEPRWLLGIDIDRLLPPWDVPQEVFDAYIADESDDVSNEVEDEGEGEGEGEDEGEYEDEDEEGEIEVVNGGEEDEDRQAEETAPGDSDRVTPWADPPAGPFDPSDLASWQWLHCSFAAVVTALDAELGSVFDELRGRGLDQTATWIVTSDRGSPLGEHGQIGVHRPWLHEELVHLPLLIRLPGAAEAGRRVAAFTQPPDLAPTLSGLFDAEPHPGSLLPLMRGEAEAIRPHAVSILEAGGFKEVAVRTEGFAFLLPLNEETRPPLLFIKPDDRWEMNDLLNQHDEAAARLRAICEAFA